MFRRIKKNKAQSMIEYSVLIALVSAAIVSMTIYVNRAVKGKMKHIESQVNEPVVLTNN
jgi:Flp pilus assembly pilin Flp